MSHYGTFSQFDKCHWDNYGFFTISKIKDEGSIKSPNCPSSHLIFCGGFQRRPTNNHPTTHMCCKPTTMAPCLLWEKSLWRIPLFGKLWNNLICFFWWPPSYYTFPRKQAAVIKRNITFTSHNNSKLFLSLGKILSHSVKANEMFPFWACIQEDSVCSSYFNIALIVLLRTIRFFIIALVKIIALLMTAILYDPKSKS